MRESMSPYQVVECLGSENMFALWLHNKESNKSEPAGGGELCQDPGVFLRERRAAGQNITRITTEDKKKKKYFTAPRLGLCPLQ